MLKYIPGHRYYYKCVQNQKMHKKRKYYEESDIDDTKRILQTLKGKKRKLTDDVMDAIIREIFNISDFTYMTYIPSLNLQCTLSKYLKGFYDERDKSNGYKRKKKLKGDDSIKHLIPVTGKNAKQAVLDLGLDLETFSSISKGDRDILIAVIYGPGNGVDEECNHWSLFAYFKSTGYCYHYDPLDSFLNTEKFKDTFRLFRRLCLIPKDSKCFNIDIRTPQRSDWECGYHVLNYIYMITSKASKLPLSELDFKVTYASLFDNFRLENNVMRKMYISFFENQRNNKQLKS